MGFGFCPSADAWLSFQAFAMAWNASSRCFCMSAFWDRSEAFLQEIMIMDCSRYVQYQYTRRVCKLATTQLSILLRMSSLIIQVHMHHCGMHIVM